MIYIMKNGGHDTYNIKQFTLDTPDDLPNLPTSGIAVGSAALVISTSDVYMLNSKGEWDLIASDTEGILPSYSAEDVGKILEVGEGGILAWAANNALPSVTSEDEGKVLKVDDQGEWVAATDSNTQYTAGANISIDANNEISAIDTKYTAGSGIEISEQNVISNIAKGNTDIIAEEYDSTKAYAVGDYCIYEDKLYKCTTAIAASNWLKAPQTLGTFAVTVNSENTDDTYFTQDQHGHWMVISEKSGQTINLNRVVDLTTTYASGNYYYNSHGYYQPSLLPYFNGGYATENEALADFSNHSSFDPSKWTKVIVTDELNSIKEDIPTYTAGTNIQISAENVISATDTTYSAGSGISIDSSNVISADSQLPTVTSADEGKVLAVNNQGSWTVQEQETIITKSVSGDLVSFSDGADAPLVDCQVHIEAVQSGSGDPSPTNVRPISGWTEANVTRTAFNVWDEEWEVGGITAVGELVTDATRIRSKNYIRLSSGESYYVHTALASTDFRVAFYDAEKAFVSNSSWLKSGSITVPANVQYAKFVIANLTTYNHDISINYPSTDHEYHAYNGSIYTISWQSEAGTVYGGTLDVKTGVLTVTHVCNRITTISSVGETGQNAILYLSPLAYSHNVSENDLKCNCLKPSNYSPNYNNHVHFANTSICALYFADVIGTTKTEWETFLDENPVYICYKIATPVTYQLTPTEIRSLLGINNVWADCGSITELKYFVQGTQPIIDYIDNSKELPSVSSSDEGKVLTVDSTGHWVASAIPDGTDTNY